MNRLPGSVRVYVACSMVTAAWCALCTLPHVRFDQPVLLLSILVLGSIAARVHLEVPFVALDAPLSISYGATLAALLLLGTPSAVFVAIVATLIQSIASRPRPRLYRALFGISVLVISVAAASLGYARFGGAPGLSLEALAGPVVAAVTTFLFVHVALIAPANAVLRRESVIDVSREMFLSAAPSYIACALATAVVVSSHSPFLMALACTPLYLVLRRQEEHERHVEQLGDLHVATTEALARAIDAKDQFCQGHIRRVQVYAGGLARALNMTTDEVRGVETAAMLHDVGKIGVPDHILSKPGPLTRDEFRRVRRHPEIGADIIAAVPFPYAVAPYIRSHHERWDGGGYPDGLAGETIPLGARILSVVDYFDALVSDRPYHKAMPSAEAEAVLIGEGGKALDQNVVRLFIALRPSLDAQLRPSEAAIRIFDPSPDQALGSPATGFAPSAQDSVFHDIASAHREMGALYEIAHGLGTCLSIDGTIDLIESKLNQLVPLSACALFVYEKETETLRCRAARGVDSNLLKQLTLRNSAGVNGWVARHRRPVTNAFARWDLQLLSADLSSVKLQSAAAWPLVVNERLIGTLGLYHVEPDYYTEERCLPLERAAERIAAVVNNALVFEQTQAESLTDPLTRLPNARQLFSFVHDELARADEQTHPVSLIIFDVDNFKRVNDQYGHDAGNRALCMVARGLSGAVRSTDLCARYAGDEFVVVLSGSDWAAAESKRVQICRAVEQMAFEVRPGVLTRVSVSSGVATLSSECRTYDDLLAEADRRMYDDKARRQALATA